MSSEIRIHSLRQRADWSADHAEAGLPSQSWAYAWGLQASGFDPHLAVVRKGAEQLLIPFATGRSVAGEEMATLPGLSGASARGAVPQLLSVWTSHAAARGWVTGYLQMSPLSDWSGAGEFGQLVTRGSLFFVDVRRHDFRRDAARTVRSKIADLENSGAELVLGPQDLLAALVRLYPESMARRGASSSYGFAEETLVRWGTADSSLLAGIRAGGEVRSVGLWHCHGTHADGHLFGCEEEWRHTFVYLWHRVLPHLAARGIHTANMGGAIGAGGLLALKRRLRVQEVPFQSLQQVYDAERYARAARDCEQTGYFPAYAARAAGHS
jgi:hypothetical protein